jgi:hypothetical protein
MEVKPEMQQARKILMRGLVGLLLGVALGGCVMILFGTVFEHISLATAVADFFSAPPQLWLLWLGACGAIGMIIGIGTKILV